MPRIKKKVGMLLKKARESSILAINVYNNPGTVFRSNGFIVLVTIAWTSLFHAIYERDNVKYYYRDKSNKRKFDYIDGEKKAWDLKQCLKFYYKDSNNALRKNLEFIIGIRNQIEHRFAPEIDPLIYGECQANLINFEELLVNEFGNRYSLADTLFFALQFSQIKTDEQLRAVRNIQSKYLEEVKAYIDNYRKNLNDDVLSDQKYSFRVFLVAKPFGREKNADSTIEFIRYDSNNPIEMEKYNNVLTLIKESKTEYSISLSKDKGNSEVLLVEKGGRGAGVVVGITTDLEKADGILVRETLSEEIFDSPSNIADAARILSQKINEFPFTERALCSIYSEREKVTSDNNTMEIFINGSFTFNSVIYTPFYYWLNQLGDSEFSKFVQDSYLSSHPNKIKSLNKLFIATGDVRWIEFIEIIADSYNKSITQANNWVYSLLEMMNEFKRSKREPIFALNEINPSKIIAGHRTNDLIKDPKTSKALLSEYCAKFSQGMNVARAQLRELDLISYFNEIAGRLPDPPNVEDYTAYKLFPKKLHTLTKHH